MTTTKMRKKAARRLSRGASAKVLVREALDTPKARAKRFTKSEIRTFAGVS